MVQPTLQPRCKDEHRQKIPGTSGQTLSKEAPSEKHLQQEYNENILQLSQKPEGNNTGTQSEDPV